MKNDLSPEEVTGIARAAHELNRAWSQMANLPVDKHWVELPDETRSVARGSVVQIIAHDLNAEGTHAAWVIEKKALGWTYGKEKDAVLKTHPCLVDYTALPEEWRIKDELWVNTVRSFVGHLWRLPQ